MHWLAIFSAILKSHKIANIGMKNDKRKIQFMNTKVQFGPHGSMGLFGKLEKIIIDLVFVQPTPSW